MNKAGSQKLCAVEFFERAQIAFRVRVGACFRKDFIQLVLRADMCDVNGRGKAKIAPRTVEQRRDQVGWGGPVAIARRSTRPGRYSFLNALAEMSAKPGRFFRSRSS